MLEEQTILIDFQDRTTALAAMKQALPQFPLLTSKNMDWDGVYLAYDYYHIPGATQTIVTPYPCILIFTEASQPVVSKRNLAGKIQQENIKVGDVVIIPPNISHQVEWETPGAWIMLAIETKIFNRTLYETVDPDSQEIIPYFAHSDLLVYQLGLKLKAEVESGGLESRLYADAVANLLSVHLLQNYATNKPQIKNYTDGLSPYKLEQVIEYINEHLDKSIGLTELARVVSMSPGYFSRLFKQSTGFAPHQYLIRCRVKRARKLLKQRQLTIAEVAYEVGFANQAHLNYHFKRLMGITPKAMQLQK